MRIAIASGKGGTGKTTVATNMAAVLAERGRSVTYIDCDVEEPNGRLFLTPDVEAEVSVGVPVPCIDQQRCTFCGQCSEICRFKALVVTPNRVLHFPELCRGCGACLIVCPEQAISESTRTIGTVTTGRRGSLGVVEGRLNVGEMQTPPLIRRTKESAGRDIVIVDSPPGTSCAAMEAVRDADFVLLVAESTPFGAHDMALAMDMLRELHLPHGVVINRDGTGNNEVRDICGRRGVDILATVPDQRRIAELCARGELLVNHLPEYKERFVQLFDRIAARVSP